MRKVFVGLLTLGAALVVIPMFAAFEAHVINVTARIENALAVPLQSINFGTVFPQEQLDRELNLALSSSFLIEDRVAIVNYVIRQKPKCWNEDENNPVFGRVTEGENGNFICADRSFTKLPVLCPYLSKHEITADGREENDLGLDAFHGLPGVWVATTTLSTESRGRLLKSDGDLTDTWMIDLKTPCFRGQCAQDWADFVRDINPDVNPADYIQPIENEHKIFGCDLWVEVTAVNAAGEDGSPPAELVTLFNDDFGTGSDSADIPGWEKHEAGTILRAPTESGEDTASPDGGRFVKIAQDSSDSGEEDGWICREVNAVGFHSLALSYYWRGDEDTEGGETGLVEYFTSGTCSAPVGGPNNLASHDLAANPTWNASNLNLPGALDGATFLLRFYNNSSADDENFRVDDVMMTGLAP